VEEGAITQLKANWRRKPKMELLVEEMLLLKLDKEWLKWALTENAPELAFVKKNGI
jgi:hypothetical protein